MLPIEKRKRPLADSEWKVVITLCVKDQPMPVLHELRYSDALLAKDPEQVGWLIARRMQDTAAQIKPPKTPRKKAAA